jgi:hypothetical protein
MFAGVKLGEQGCVDEGDKSNGCVLAAAVQALDSGGW